MSRALVYFGLYGLALVPGLVAAVACFGRSVPALIAGAPLGYALTALALWVPIAVGRPTLIAFICSWLVVAIGAVVASLFVRSPVVRLPPWNVSASGALAVVLVATVLLVARPYSRIGEQDDQGNKRYRAYFTADFVWHEALTAEIGRFSSAPRNPYYAGKPLQYYWLYFVPPAVAAGLARSHAPPIETYLAVNGICTGVLLVSAIFLATWIVVGRPWIAAMSVALVLFAWSAEGTYAVLDLLFKGQPVALVRELNIDAITSWYFGGLTIDGLPRSIWYNPQHSLACTLGLIALVIAAASGAGMSASAAVLAGVCLGFAVMLSPFPGGVLTLTYGVSLLIMSRGRDLFRMAATQLIAIAAVVSALGWCMLNRTFEGAGSAITVGLSTAARSSPAEFLALSVGPVLLPALCGIAILLRRRPSVEAIPAATGFVVALVMLFFVTLELEPVWIGWRAGQVLLITAPGVIAIALARWFHWNARVAAAAVALLFAIGIPTALIDAYNAQDTSNEAMGPGFRWTVVISRSEQEALEWIQRWTPRDALVQMSLNPRGRETWSLIPSFARRRMAGGLPISLLRTPDYDERAARIDRIFSSPDPEEASTLARNLRIDYLFVGRVEREAFGESLKKFQDRPDLFYPVFGNDEVAIYAIK